MSLQCHYGNLLLSPAQKIDIFQMKKDSTCCQLILAQISALVKCILLDNSTVLKFLNMLYIPPNADFRFSLDGGCVAAKKVGLKPPRATPESSLSPGIRQRTKSPVRKPRPKPPIPQDPGNAFLEGTWEMCSVAARSGNDPKHSTPSPFSLLSVELEEKYYIWTWIISKQISRFTILYVTFPRVDWCVYILPDINFVYGI